MQFSRWLVYRSWLGAALVIDAKARREARHPTFSLAELKAPAKAKAAAAAPPRDGS